MKITLGVLLLINVASAVFNITNGDDLNTVIGIVNLVVACFLTVALTIEMTR